MTGEDILRRYYDAYNAGDEERLRALLADDVALVPIAGGGEAGAEEIRGVEAYLATYRTSLASFQDVMEPQAIEAEGNVVTVDLRNLLTAREDVDDFFGISARSGETVTLRLIARYTIADGRIVRIAITPKA